MRLEPGWPRWLGGRRHAGGTFSHPPRRRGDEPPAPVERIPPSAQAPGVAGRSSRHSGRCRSASEIPRRPYAPSRRHPEVLQAQGLRPERTGKAGGRTLPVFSAKPPPLVGILEELKPCAPQANPSGTMPVQSAGKGAWTRFKPDTVGSFVPLGDRAPPEHWRGSNSKRRRGRGTHPDRPMVPNPIHRSGA